jgi:glucans biosynthesis protein
MSLRRRNGSPKTLSGGGIGAGFSLKMGYDDWRDIRFDPSRALWANQKFPFTLQFFHPGLFYDRTVVINIVDPTGVHPVPFSPNLFDYGRNDFKIKSLPIWGSPDSHSSSYQHPDYHDEVAVFVRQATSAPSPRT